MRIQEVVRTVKTKKVPQRSCVGCGLKTDKKDLVRIVKTPNGEIILDRTGKQPGRGVYICSKAECLTAAIKRKAIERALSCKISNDILVELNCAINDKNDQ